MDNSDSIQQNFINSSSNDDKDANFITQENYTKKTKRVKKTHKITNSPLNELKTINTMKLSQWKGDSFDNEMNDEDYIEQRKRDKVLNMIKNAHIEKRKTNLTLVLLL